MGSGLRGLGFWGLGSTVSRVEGLRFRVWGLGLLDNYLMSSSGNWDLRRKAVEDTCEEHVQGLSTHPFLAILSA